VLPFCSGVAEGDDCGFDSSLSWTAGLGVAVEYAENESDCCTVFCWQAEKVTAAKARKRNGVRFMIGSIKGKWRFVNFGKVANIAIINQILIYFDHFWLIDHKSF
jgi:hypothetical protein